MSVRDFLASEGTDFDVVFSIAAYFSERLGVDFRDYYLNKKME